MYYTATANQCASDCVADPTCTSIEYWYKWSNGIVTKYNQCLIYAGSGTLQADNPGVAACVKC